MVNKSKLTFRSWLWTFLEDDSPIGDLARDAKEDKGWKGRSVYSLEDRLNKLRVCQDVKNSMLEAKSLFLRDN